MEFMIGDKVRIIWNNVIGEIIDIYSGKNNGKRYYIVEGDTDEPTDDPRAYPPGYPMFDCLADEIEKV